MKHYFHSSVTAMALTAMVMGGVVVSVVGLSAAPAFSKSNNANSGRGNSNRGGNGNGESGNGNGASGNGNGASAPSLGALNAAHANANAFANAAENSRVGMIEVYKTAVGITVDAKEALDKFIKECGDGETELDIELVPYCIKVLEDAAEEEENIGSFDTETYIDFLEEAFGAARDLENGALLAAANKETSEAVIEALWDMLEIDGYEIPPPIE